MVVCGVARAGALFGKLGVDLVSKHDTFQARPLPYFRVVPRKGADDINNAVEAVHPVGVRANKYCRKPAGALFALLISVHNKHTGGENTKQTHAIARGGTRRNNTDLFWSGNQTPLPVPLSLSSSVRLFRRLGRCVSSKGPSHSHMISSIALIRTG